MSESEFGPKNADLEDIESTTNNDPSSIYIMKPSSSKVSLDKIPKI